MIKSASATTIFIMMANLLVKSINVCCRVQVRLGAGGRRQQLQLSAAFCTVSTSGNATYNHLHRDWDGAVECWVPTIFCHHRQVDHPVGNLLIVQRFSHTDHWRVRSRWQKLFAVTQILQDVFNNLLSDTNSLNELWVIPEWEDILHSTHITITIILNIRNTKYWIT